jgi:hypothetical protein
MNGPHCAYTAASFEATVIDTIDTRIIHVTGEGLCPTTGWRLELLAANPGVVPHPETLWLEVREVPPTHPRARVLSETRVEAMIEDAHAEEVLIRFRWREGFVLPLHARARSTRGEREMSAR